jgi:hypothetical protein
LAGARSAAVRSAFAQTLEEFFGENGGDVMHRVDLGDRDIVPAHAEPFNLASISSMTKYAFS